MDVDYFISKQYEEKINKKMMYYNYVFPTIEVKEYISDICNIQIGNIVDYIIEANNPEIGSKDIFQFSSFEDATTRLCQKLIEVDNPGLKHVEIGRLLLNDGKNRNDGAYTKYGENHAKTGNAIGLIQELSKTYFLSCIGTVFCDIDDNLRDKLLVRLLLRNNLIRRIITATKNGNVDMRNFLFMLSYSTYVRRSSNIKTIMKCLEKNQEFDFTVITDRMIYTIEKN